MLASESGEVREKEPPHISTKAGKRRYIKTLLKRASIGILDSVKKMPDHWDGHELREFVYEYFEQCRSRPFEEDKRRRKRFKNECYANGL